MKRIIIALGALLLVLGSAVLSAQGAYPAGPSSTASGSMADPTRSFGLPKVVPASYSDTSPPLRSLKSKPSSSVKMGQVMER